MSCCRFSCSPGPAGPPTADVLTALPSLSCCFSSVSGRGGVAGVMLMEARYVPSLSSPSRASPGAGLGEREMSLVEEARLP